MLFRSARVHPLTRADSETIVPPRVRASGRTAAAAVVCARENAASEPARQGSRILKSLVRTGRGETIPFDVQEASEGNGEAAETAGQDGPPSPEEKRAGGGPRIRDARRGSGHRGYPSRPTATPRRRAVGAVGISVLIDGVLPGLAPSAYSRLQYAKTSRPSGEFACSTDRIVAAG